MVYPLVLLCVAGVGLWMVLDVLRSARRAPAPFDLLALAATVALWAGGELMIQLGRSGDDIVLGRRVLYAGACLLPVAWLWVGTRTAGARWGARPSRALLLASLPSLFFYSFLYWDTQGRFIVWYLPEPRVGPWFWAFVAYGWALVLVGTGFLVSAAIRHGAARPLKAVAILAAAMAPLVANFVHLASNFGGADPTPAFVGAGALLLRFAVIDSGLAAVLPRARRDVIEQLESGVVVANLQGRVVDVNPAAARLLGDERLVGGELDRVLARVPSDPDRVLEVEEFAVDGALGEVGRCVVITDRTETRRVEQQLVLAQRLESLGILTAGIAHEVNNPLAFVCANLGRLEELVKELDAPDVRRALRPEARETASEASDLVAEMRDGVDRIVQLVTNLRLFARHDDGSGRGPVSLQGVARRASVVAGVGNASGAIRETFGEAPPVEANEPELVQVVLNLLVNAIQAGGRESAIEIHVGSARGGAFLRVRDHGPGIAPHALLHLFDPFFTTKAPGEGTGLGLSLSFDLVRKHGGTLEGHNCEGGGACFELWLPAAPGAERVADSGVECRSPRSVCGPAVTGTAQRS